MESKIEQLSLTEALSEARISTLPPTAKNTNKIWVKAIVKVRKCNGSTNYAIGVNNGAGYPIIVNDYGASARIARIEEIYPFLFMASRGIPDMRSKNDIIEYLGRAGYNRDDVVYLLSTKDKCDIDKSPEQENADRKIVKQWVYETAIRHELKKVDDSVRAEKMRDMYEEGRVETED